MVVIFPVDILVEMIVIVLLATHHASLSIHSFARKAKIYRTIAYATIKKMPEKSTEVILSELQESRQNFVKSFALVDLFSVLYEPITRLTLATVTQKTAHAPEATLNVTVEATVDIVVQFYAMYQNSRGRFLGGQSVEKHWQPYYDFVRRHQRYPRHLQATQVRDVLFAGIEAHVRDDLPRVLSSLPRYCALPLTKPRLFFQLPVTNPFIFSGRRREIAK
jgi:hypothetical protein